MSEQQGNLFGAGVNAYGERAAPLSRQNDPESSHAAGDRHKRSGRLKAHAEIALSLVARHPGSTFHELFAAATDGEREALGDPVELMRRLSGLRNDGKLRNGPTRACRIKRSKMLTWVLA